MSDRDFLMWIHARLEHVHGENPITDYMHKLRSIIKRITSKDNRVERKVRVMSESKEQRETESASVQSLVMPPRKAFEIEIRCGGHDWESAISELERMVDHLRDHGPECGFCSGNGLIRVEENSGQTVEQYNEQLSKYVDQLRRERRAESA